MPGIHFDNFVSLYGITPGKSQKNRKDKFHLWNNLVKLSTYIPIIGTLTHVLGAGMYIIDKKHPLVQK